MRSGFMIKLANRKSKNQASGIVRGFLIVTIKKKIFFDVKHNPII